MTLRLGMAQINVTDIAAAKAFYIDTLGFTANEPFGPKGPFELINNDGPKLMVFKVSKSVPFDYPDQTGTGLVFFTDDLTAAIAEWTAKGVEFIKMDWADDESGVGETPFGSVIAFRDPFGNVHELMQPK